MSVVRINAITVPAERAEQLAAGFAARAGQVDTRPEGGAPAASGADLWSFLGEQQAAAR